MARILTQRGVETAKPKAKRYGRPDGLVPGMQLVVQPSGSKSYTLFTRINGTLINIRLGSAGVLTLAQAREEARAKLGLVAAGKDPRAAKPTASAAVTETFAIVAQRFVERHAKVHNRKWRETVQMLERDVLPRWRHRPIDSVTKRDVIALLDGIVDRGAPVMANRTLAMLRKLFNWSIERGVLEASPCDRVKRPGAEAARDRVLSDDELALVWRAAGSLPYPSGPFFRLLILSGQRRTEVSGMTWAELDPALALWVLPRARVKTDVEHALPVSTAMRDILRNLPRIASAPGYVFTINGQAALAGFCRIKHRLDAAITTLNDGAPIPPWTPHDLRRSAATGMAKLGIGLPTVEKILNHRSGSFGGVAGIYMRHTFRDEMAAALETWGRHVQALAKPPIKSEPLLRAGAGR